MLMILKYLKMRYIDCHLDERAQGMVEYAVLIASIIGVAAYLIYGNSYGHELHNTFDGASETLDAADRNNNGN